VGKLEPPGVLVEENKRRKLLSELGVEMRLNATTAAKQSVPVAESNLEESKGGELIQTS
jgi:hypothetical protein